jgi:hypothetical protein
MSTSKIIEYLLRYRPSAKWIQYESGLPYLKLDIKTPWEEIYKEWHGVKDQAVLHRDTDYHGPLQNAGWSSLTLYGINATETANVSDNMSWTTIAERCPQTVKWLTDNFIINENTKRIRFMLLEAGGFIIPHTDRNTKGLMEINIAIVNPDNCTFRFKNYGTVPFTNGDAFIMDVSNEHFVVNDSIEPRLHIIVHSRLKDEKILEDSYANRYYR